MTTTLSLLRALSFLVIALLCGCHAPAAPDGVRTGNSALSATAAGFPLKVTDDSGREVTLAAPPARILCLSPAHTETLYALGAGERLVAADTYSDYPPEVKPKATLNCWPRPPLEQMVALKPDLVLILTQGDDFITQMEALKIPVLKLFPKTYDEALREIVLLGSIVGEEARGEEIVRSMRARGEAVRKAVAGVTPKRVLYELDATDPARPYVAGNGGFYGTLLSLAGGENVFADVQRPSDQVSAEQIVKRNPETILLGDSRSPVQPQSPETVRQRPGWSRIAAVQKGSIYAVNSDQITRPGPRLVDGLEDIARRLHPERFR